MRIALVVSQFPVVSETFVLNIARAAIDAGHHLDIISILGAPEPPGPEHPDIAEYDLMRRHITPHVPASWIGRYLRAGPALARARAMHGRLAWHTIPPLNWQWRALNLRLLYESGVLPKEGYDVIHCQFATLAPAILQHRALGTVRGRVLVHIRGYDITSELRRLGPGFYRRTFREADGFVANSAHFKRTAIAAGCPEDRIDVVFSGLELGRFPFRQRVAAPGEVICLVSVGRLTEKKGHRYTLQALAALKARGVQARLEIVGDGVLRDGLEAEARALGITSETTFHGATSSERVAQILSGGHIFLAHSVTAANGDQDAPTNTVKEAMAVGLPVIATRHGGYPEIVHDGETGFLVEEGDATAVADHVERLSRAPDSWTTITTAARRLVEKTCATDVVHPQILSIYHRLAAG
ncbi:MAG: glycosyltransferase [Pseudomonadota bacterium]